MNILWNMTLISSRMSRMIDLQSDVKRSGTSLWPWPEWCSAAAGHQGAAACRLLTILQVFVHTDWWRLRLAESSVLQPSTACSSPVAPCSSLLLLLLLLLSSSVSPQVLKMKL